MKRLSVFVIAFLLTSGALGAQSQNKLKVAGATSGLSITSSYKFYVSDNLGPIAAIHSDGSVTFLIPEADAARKLLTLFQTSSKREWELQNALEGALLYVDYARKTNQILWDGRAKLPPDTIRFRAQIEADLAKWTALTRNEQ